MTAEGSAETNHLFESNTAKAGQYTSRKRVIYWAYAVDFNARKYKHGVKHVISTSLTDFTRFHRHCQERQV